MESAPFGLFMQVAPVKQESFGLIFSKIQMEEFAAKHQVRFHIVFIIVDKPQCIRIPCPVEGR